MRRVGGNYGEVFRETAAGRGIAEVLCAPGLPVAERLRRTADRIDTALGLSLTSSQNWADIVIGGRVQLPMGEKIVIDVLGDVGGWNATAKLDYQFATLLRYKLSPKWMAAVGYRYLFVDYRGNNAALFNVVTSGALVGLTYRL